METRINSFSDCKILLIGDPILDIYLKGNATRICREAPAPVFEVRSEEAVCGGAGNTAINLAALGASACFTTVTGNDAYADRIISILRANHVNVSTVLRDPKRSTVVKQRLLADTSILYRIDQGSTTSISPDMENELIRKISMHWDSADIIILSDYGTGVITPRIIEFIADVQHHLPKSVVVDAKDPSRFAVLKPLAVKPNYAEAISMLGLEAMPRAHRATQILQKQDQLHQLTGAQYISVTLDKDGVLLLEKDGGHHRILCIPFDNRNAIGAGDTFTAAFSLAMARGADAREACQIAAHAAAVVVQKEGTAGCSQSELLAHLNVLPKYMSNKSQLQHEIHKLKVQGKRIVFANGCFDILHKGHINLLEEARKLGDVLVVAVNTDAGVTRLKGPGRPIITLEDRVSVLSALEAVDIIVAYEEDTCENLVRSIAPDVFVKGNTWKETAVPEAVAVRETGGTVEILPSPYNHSTSGIINRIRMAGLVSLESS